MFLVWKDVPLVTTDVPYEILYHVTENILTCVHASGQFSVRNLTLQKIIMFPHVLHTNYCMHMHVCVYKLVCSPAPAVQIILHVLWLAAVGQLARSVIQSGVVLLLNVCSLEVN